ncbi:hypothetical protein KPNJ2_03794 [Klebsiella pneumoniae 30684/NJST258_2]|uniref:Uncharacterized protein n=1 Tax=Klebsiella pneumoniae 30684/NJST258_2 TaxID=1420013 RepID=W8UKZ6_KLEPN|nr:hypothetical protein KPNJ2_03794 [Klebsiella pneumoniae 30684/NJST258_2]
MQGFPFFSFLVQHATLNPTFTSQNRARQKKLNN